MSFILQPGTIPHIQHLYQPTETDWDIASGIALELMNMVNTSFQTKVTAWKLGISHKIDDRVSMKVAKIDGEYYVGYKGLNSPFLDTNEQIDFVYRDKDYISAPMKVLLKHATTIIPKDWDNVEVQVGILWYSNIYGVYAPYEITPNVVTYRTKNMTPFTELVVSLVTATQIIDGNRLSFVYDLSPFAKGSNQVFVLNPGIKYWNSVKTEDYSPDIIKIIKFRDNMIENRDFHAISGFEIQLQEFYNWINRQRAEGSFRFPVYNQFLLWYKNIYIVKKVTKLKKEINQKKKFIELSAKVEHIESNKDAFRRSIHFCNNIKLLSLKMLKEVNDGSFKNFIQGDLNEGIVLTYPYDFSSIVVFKIVPPEFSIANFKKYQDLSE